MVAPSTDSTARLYRSGYKRDKVRAMNLSMPIVCVAIATPLSRLFDYAIDAITPPDRLIGCRVEVPFGRSIRVGVVISCRAKTDIPAEKLKRVRSVLDDEPLLTSDLLSLIRWASDYYHHPIGEVVSTALPVLLRKAKTKKSALATNRQHWQLSAKGRLCDIEGLKNAPLQRRIINYLQKNTRASPKKLAELSSGWRQAVSRLTEMGYLERCQVPVQRDADTESTTSPPRPALNKEQSSVLEILGASAASYQAFLLDGVTGSGKTEVYLHYAEQILQQGKQVLVLVPEIGLTPQLHSRFGRRFGNAVVCIHSGLSDGERLRHWQSAASGNAKVIIGTRSSVFVPLKQMGLIIVDEEHDHSLKQQDGFRYHARDLALVRARNADVPVVMGSATPSLESLYNASQGKYRALNLRQRAGHAAPPSIHLIDVRRHSLNEGLSAPLVQAMQEHLERNNQVMLFLNRRGYAPTLLCDQCGTIVDCQRCDVHMVVHAAQRQLRCHHCGAQRPIPPHCKHCASTQLTMAGQGTERIDYALRSLFPQHTLVRIDRDTTRHKGSLQAQLERASSGTANILIGTQMLAKGHHFPNVTLVAMLDVDRGLFGVDFRAMESMAQTIVQVAGRSGRASTEGKVLIQTRYPDHVIFQTLLHQGYAALSWSLLDERRSNDLPPYSHLALLRSEAASASVNENFLRSVRQQCQPLGDLQVNILGPASAPIERISGRYRGQLLFVAKSRLSLHRLMRELRALLEGMREGRRVRWSLDIDPVDLS